MLPTANCLCALDHCRSDWVGNEIVRVCGRWGLLKGVDQRTPQAQAVQQKLYRAAKCEADRLAAKRIVDDMVTEAVIDGLIDDLEDFMAAGRPIVLVVPTPAFGVPEEVDEDGRGNVKLLNVLPAQFAAHLAERLDAEVDTEILQIARVGRTTAKELERFLWQPHFQGTVRTDVAYVIVDDVLTWGGTLAALRSFIIANGGTVAAYATLACGRPGDQPLAISKQTLESVVGQFGNDFGSFWKGEIGHVAQSLTEAEGRYLAGWSGKNPPRAGVAPLQHLRNCFLETAGRGQHR